MEDTDIVLDLRASNGRQDNRFDVFWNECQTFLNEDLGTAVDDRRHDLITHLACAISIRDLVEQVKQRCPPHTLIPSNEWVRLQFWPKTPTATKAVQHTGRFKLKFMVQQCHHVDSHYASASLREYSITVCEYCAFVCLDDKHKIKVGEPGYPVAATERGRRVPVRHFVYHCTASF